MSQIKICPRCGKEKKITIVGYCEECASEYGREWRKKHSVEAPWYDWWPLKQS